uniref:Thioredoxin domain-containing protein n=1 Tax=Schistocephalus solidus TaxID=70667 RepID=A0A183TR25_SCHSO
LFYFVTLAVMGLPLSRFVLYEFFIIALTCAIGDALYENDGTIHVLDHSNFTEFISKQPTLVQFYLSNCGACQKYVVTFKNLSNAVKDWRWAVKLAVIDCASEENNRLVRTYNVSYFPQFLVCPTNCYVLAALLPCQQQSRLAPSGPAGAHFQTAHFHNFLP